jgi:hypothetical protein
MNNKYKKKYNGKDGYAREGRDNRENRENRENKDNRDNRKQNIKKFEGREKSYKMEKTFNKNPNGFLVVSLFIKAKTPFNVAVNSIEGAIAIDSKKKVVISFEDQNDKQLISGLKKKFEGSFGVLFFNPKSKMKASSPQNSAKVHSEVFNAFKSNFFLTLDGSAVLRPFSVEKMISFLCKEGDTLAVSPKFYTSSGEIIKSCRRFPSIWNFLPEFSDFIKNKNTEHLMMERGDVGYYSIHRVDYSSLDCMLFLTDALAKIKSFSSGFKNQDIRDAKICKKFYKKTGGKIIFYPHARVVLHGNEFDAKPSLMEKIKYYF